MSKSIKSGDRQPRGTRKSQKIYYFIVEGCTEENYLKCLKILYKKEAKIHNCKGGNAKNFLQTAKKIREKDKTDEYLGYIVWFDQDRYDVSLDSNLKQSLQAQPSVKIYMSEPCIENWLLAHFQPINLCEYECKVCETKLRDYIPKYQKNDCHLLSKFITTESIKNAKNNYRILDEIIKKYFEK